MKRWKLLVGLCVCFGIASIVLAGGGTPTIDIQSLTAPMNKNRIDDKVKIDANGATLQNLKVYAIPVGGGPGFVGVVPKPNAARPIPGDITNLKAGNYSCIFEVEYDPIGSAYKSISQRPADVNVTGKGGFLGNWGTLVGGAQAGPPFKITAFYTPPPGNGWSLNRVRFVMRQSAAPGSIIDRPKTATLNGRDYAVFPPLANGNWDFWVYGVVEKGGVRQGFLFSAIGKQVLPVAKD